MEFALRGTAPIRGPAGQWHYSALARSFLACSKPWCVFTAAVVWKTRSDFAEAGKEQGGMWSCVPQELWTSYLHCLSSPWTTDQRQGGIWWPPPHSLPPPFLFVSPLSVSLTPLLPFPSLTLYHPLCCSLAFFPSLLSFIPLTNLRGGCRWWLMWIDGRSSAYATIMIRCALFICHWILFQSL